MKILRNNNKTHDFYKSFLICFLTLVLLTLSLPLYVSADDGADGIRFADDSSIGHMQKIRYPFLDTMTVADNWTFPYSDRFFDIPPEQFSLAMARGSLGIALSAFRSTAGVVDPQYENYLRDAGFTHLYAFGYDQPTREDTLSGVIAMKRIRGTTVIAAVTCGQGYQNEWAGNLKVGKGERHEGFSIAAELLKSHIRQYIEDNNIEGPKKLWLNGISRAAAVANITAADAIESGEYDAVYAYLFGVPRTTKRPVAYKGIYNICGQYDPVASVPLQSWGYERYGTDLYTPSQESSSAYPELAKAASEVGMKLDGEGFRNNPEINTQLRLILEYMDEFFDGGDEYTDRFQDTIISVMNQHQNKEQILIILSEAFKSLTPEDRREKSSIRTVIDYLSFMAAQHLRANQRQISSGSWNPDEPLAANLMLEHRPSTYVRWLFSDDDPERILNAPVTSRRLVITGDVNVRVYDSEGKESDTTAGEVFMMRNGSQTIVCLPEDDSYRIEIGSGLIRNFSYYSYSVSPEKLMPGKLSIHFGQLRNGKIVLDAAPGENAEEKESVLGGTYYRLGGTSYQYLPSQIMREELDATKRSYFSISGAFRLLSIAVSIESIILLSCLVIAVRHKKKIKKGHPPYSDWYVIVPHLLFIVIMTYLASYFYLNLFSLDAARSEISSAAVFVTFLLALRGSIRRRNLPAYAVTAFLLAMVYVTKLYFSGALLDTHPELKLALFIAGTAALSAAAVLTFRREPVSRPALAEQKNDE